MRVISKVRRNVQDYGIGQTLKKLLAGVFGVIYSSRTYRIYRFDTAHFDRTLQPPAGFAFGFLSPEDDELIRAVEDVAEWLQGELKDKLSRGDLCLVATDHGRLAGFNLVQFGTVHIPLVNLTRNFRSREAWSEHIAVLPDFRKRGLATALRESVFHELNHRGIDRFYGGTLVSNTPALRLAASLGFVSLMDITYGRVLGRKFWRFRGVRT